MVGEVLGGWLSLIGGFEDLGKGQSLECHCNGWRAFFFSRYPCSLRS
jgi:hypothetical protein